MSLVRQVLFSSVSRVVVTGGLVASYVILLNMQETKECTQGDYLNPSFLAKLLSMVDLTQTAIAVYGHLDEIKATGNQFLKKATFASGIGAIGSLAGLWGATGKKAAIATKVLNPVMNLMTERFAHAYAKSGNEKQNQSENGGDVPLLYQNMVQKQMEEGKGQQYGISPPGYKS